MSDIIKDCIYVRCLVDAWYHTWRICLSSKVASYIRRVMKHDWKGEVCKKMLGRPWLNLRGRSLIPNGNGNGANSTARTKSNILWRGYFSNFQHVKNTSMSNVTRSVKYMKLKSCRFCSRNISKSIRIKETEGLRKYRELALDIFESDYCTGLIEKRYLKGSFLNCHFKIAALT